MFDSGKETMAFAIALITMVCGFWIIANRPDQSQIAVPLMTFVLGYYFGSSPGSHAKDQTINDLALKRAGSDVAVVKPEVVPTEEIK